MSLSQELMRHFKSQDIYQVLDISQESLSRDIRASCYQLIMREHPDLKPSVGRVEALQKCRLVARILRVFTDDKLRALYDAHGKGIAEVESAFSSISSSSSGGGDAQEEENPFNIMLAECLDLTGSYSDTGLFSPFVNFHLNYKGSQLERMDIREAYRVGKGCMDRIIIELPLMTVQDEPRIRRIIRRLIKDEVLPSYPGFIREPLLKRRNRHTKFAFLTEEEKQDRFIVRMLRKYGEDILPSEEDKSMDLDVDEKIPTMNTEDLRKYVNGLVEKYGSQEDMEILKY
ncbi:hypothetical protein KR009_005931, partial [Drosophila setifemur]